MALTTLASGAFAAEGRWSDAFGVPGLLRGPVPAYVRDSIVFQNDLVVCGAISDSAAERMYGLARWDGQSWKAMGAGPRDPVALAVYHGELYAGGFFWDGILKSVTGAIWRWTGDDWRPFFAPWDECNSHDYQHGYCTTQVRDLLVYGNHLYAAADAGVLRFDGSSLVAISQLNVREWVVWDDVIVAAGEDDQLYQCHGSTFEVWQSADVTALGVHDGALLAGFSRSRSGLHQWNGDSWVRVGEGDRRFPRLIEVWNGQPLVLSAEGFHRWDGTSWHLIPGGPSPGTIRTMTPLPTGFYVAGSFADVGARANAVALYDDSWHALGSGDGLYHRVVSSTLWNGHLVIANSAGVRRWNDPGWETLSDMNEVTTVRSAAGLLFVGRLYGEIWLSTEGGQWLELGPGVARWNVHDIVLHGGQLVAAGDAPWESPGAAGAVRWDGDEWVDFAVGLPPADFYDLQPLDDELYAVADVDGRHALLRSENDTWTVVLEWPRPLTQLAASHGSLLVAGEGDLLRVDPGGSPVVLAQGLGTVTSLDVTDHRLRLVSDGQPLEWTGDGFQLLGGGVDGYPELLWAPRDVTLVPTARGFYLTGNFRYAGDHPSRFVAEWIESAVTATTPVPLEPRSRLGTISPNPFNPRTTIEVVLSTDEPAFLDIHDVRGRRLNRLPVPSGRGDHVVSWDGRDARGHALGSGVYFVRLVATGASEVRRITLLR